MPAPLANKNARKHGVHSYLAMARLPRGCSYVGRLVGQLRSHLTRSVQDSGRTVGVVEAGLINSACRHEARAHLFGRYLRVEPDLPVATRIQLLKEIGFASNARDRCLMALRLDVPAPSSPWESWPDVPALAGPDAGDEALAIVERDEAATLDLIEGATSG